MVYPAMLGSQQVRVVYQDCNSTWMSRLEAGVKKMLGPMIKRGQATKLTLEYQRLLATWAVKTALIMEQIQIAEQGVPDSEYHRFYSIQEPPNGYEVWIAHRTLRSSGSTERALLAAARKTVVPICTTSLNATREVQRTQLTGRKAFGVTFVIGRVAFQIFGHNAPNGGPNQAIA